MNALGILFLELPGKMYVKGFEKGIQEIFKC